MSDSTIEWTRGDDGALGKTWNPVRGCSRVSPGCDSCYAMGQAHRFAGAGKPYEGLTTLRKGKVDWSGVARFVPEMLDAPLRWRKPRRIFVNSMSDLFHHSVTNEEIAAVFGVMAACPQHVFQVLTKRPERMGEWFKRLPMSPRWHLAGAADEATGGKVRCPSDEIWPLPWVWLGVSAEDQQRADERIPHLLATPAAVRFVSAEPLIGPIDFERIVYSRHYGTGLLNALTGKKRDHHGHALGPVGDLPALSWVIAGGESGPGARPCDVGWIRSIVEQCREAGVPAFVKQLGANPVPLKPMRLPSWNATTGQPHRGWIDDTHYALSDSKGGDPLEWPPEFRVREFPEARP